MKERCASRISFCWTLTCRTGTACRYAENSSDNGTLHKKKGGSIKICGVPIEQAKEIRSMTGYLPVIMLRVVYSLAVLALILGGFLLMMRFRESAVTWRHFAVGFTSAFFLGALGFAAAGISGNAPAGYMVSLIYYIANFSLKNKLGKLFLFSMYAGSFEEKIIFSRYPPDWLY